MIPRDELRKVIGAIGLTLAFLIALILQGCQPLTPQVIEYCGTYHLYTDSNKLWQASRDAGADWQRFGAFYNPNDDSIHAMKWDFNGMGHEVYHGLYRNGLIIEEGIGQEHFRRK